MNLQITEYTQLNDRLLSEWQKLWNSSSSAHAFNSPQWFLLCQKTFPSKKYLILTVRSQGGLKAVLPLCQDKKFGFRAWTGPGGERQAKSSLLVHERDPKILSGLSRHLSGQFNFYLTEIDYWTALMLKGSQPYGLQEKSESSFTLAHESILSLHTKKTHYKLYSRLKKIKAKLELKTFSGSQEALDIAFAIDESSRKWKQNRATFGSKEERDFFRQMMEEFKDRATVDVLYYEGSPMVFSVNLVYKKTYYALKTAFKEEYKGFSPGRLISYYLLEKIHKEGFEVLDFGRGVTQLKKEFASGSYKQYDLFYSKNILVNSWWKIASALFRAKTKLYENPTYYKFYLARKKFIAWLKNFFSPAEFSSVPSHQKTL